MRTIPTSLLSVAAAGALVATLAGCAESGTSTGPGQQAGASSNAAVTATPSTSAIPAPAAQIPAVTGVHTQVMLDQGFVSALSTLKLTPGTTGTATLKDGTLTFPITGGDVTYWDPSTGYRPYVQGELLHQGSGITLKGGDVVVGLSDFVIHPGNDSYISGTVKANGKTVGTNVDVFRLDGSTLQPLTKDADGNAVLQGTTVYVSKDAAALLDTTFGTTAVTGDLEVGVAKLTVK